jgi:hypothetical protein
VSLGTVPAGGDGVFCDGLSEWPDRVHGGTWLHCPPLVDNGDELASFELADVRTARFSPDGTHVAFGTNSGDLLQVDVPLSADPGTQSSVTLAIPADFERN